jgi:hypothetical protein
LKYFCEVSHAKAEERKWQTSEWVIIVKMVGKVCCNGLGIFTGNFYWLNWMPSKKSCNKNFRIKRKFDIVTRWKTEACLRTCFGRFRIRATIRFNHNP